MKLSINYLLCSEKISPISLSSVVDPSIEKLNKQNSLIQNTAISLLSDKIENAIVTKDEPQPDSLSKINAKYVVQIVDAKKYPDKDEAIKSIERISSESLLSISLNDSEWEKKQIFLAVDNEKKIVGFLLGELRESDFYVERLVVEQSQEILKNFSREKIGTRLMFQAMQKTKEIGKKLLYLEYDPLSSYSYMRKEEDQKKYIKECERRNAFYLRFEEFDVDISYKDLKFWDSDPRYGYDLTRMTYFNIERFNLDKSLEILFCKSMKMLQQVR